MNVLKKIILLSICVAAVKKVNAMDLVYSAAGGAGIIAAGWAYSELRHWARFDEFAKETRENFKTVRSDIEQLSEIVVSNHATGQMQLGILADAVDKTIDIAKKSKSFLDQFKEKTFPELFGKVDVLDAKTTELTTLVGGHHAASQAAHAATQKRLDDVKDGQANFVTREEFDALKNMVAANHSASQAAHAATHQKIDDVLKAVDGVSQKINTHSGIHYAVGLACARALNGANAARNRPSSTSIVSSGSETSLLTDSDL